MERIARVAPSLAAIGVAAVAWLLLTALFVDVLDLGRTEATAASRQRSDDPCALRDPLPVGTDARCFFDLARGGQAPLVVDLDQRWTGNLLVQWLNVRPAGSSDTLHFVYAQNAGTPTSRLLRLFAVHSATGDDHLGYLIGRCGAPACPLSDLVVVGEDGGRFRSLLNLRLGAFAEVQLQGGGVTALEAWFPAGATAPGGMVARRFGWGGGNAYALRDMSIVPVPTPSPR